MWQLKLDGAGVVVASSQGSGKREVIVLLDPPRNALAADAYGAAQRNASALFSRIPTDEPFVVALQEEFWTELDHRKDEFARGGVPASYLNTGGLGIVDALAGMREPPPYVLADHAGQVVEYELAEAAAIKAMTTIGPALVALGNAYHRATEICYSTALAEFTAAAARAWDPTKKQDVVPTFTEGAAAAGIDLTVPAFRLVAQYTRLREYEAAFAQEAVEAERERLVAAIVFEATPERIPARAAWELYRFDLSKDVPGDDDAEARIAEIDAILASDAPPPPPPEAHAAVQDIVTYAVPSDMVRIEPGIDKHNLLGGGENIAVKLELAAILGIDLSAYPTLPIYINYCAVNQQMGEASKGQIAASIAKVCRKLDNAIRARLAETDLERSLVALEPAIRFVEALGRYQYVHDESLRPVVTRFDAIGAYEAIVAAGAPAPDTWKADAERINSSFEPIRRFFDLTIVRAKDLALRLLNAIDDREMHRGVLVCDGYLNPYLARTFGGNDVSYVLCAPKW